MNRWVMAMTVVLVAALAGLPGCGAGDDDNDGGNDYGGDNDDVQDFLDAIPDEESLTLALPSSGETAKAGLGELAVLYDQTVDFTRDVNEHVLMFLSWIDEITSYPPSAPIDGGYVWGPWTDSGLSPVEGRFWMTRADGETYDYGLQWRPRDSEGEWTDIWLGRTTASTDTVRRGVGAYGVDFTAAKALDPTVDPVGVVDVDYDTVTDGREIAVEYVGFFNEEDDMTAPLDAQYFYRSHADLTGQFLFDWFMDIHYDEYHGEQYPALEHAWFNTRWESSGAGRADVTVTDGDLPDIEYEGQSVSRYGVSECWGNDFLRSFYRGTAVMENGDEWPYEDEGDEGSCVFDEALPEI
jgi:hypothetical protein